MVLARDSTIIRNTGRAPTYPEDLRKEFLEALTIVDEETRRFMGDMHHRSTAPVIEQLRAGWNETGEAELDRLFRKLPNLDWISSSSKVPGDAGRSRGCVSMWECSLPKYSGKLWQAKSQQILF